MAKGEHMTYEAPKIQLLGSVAELTEILPDDVASVVLPQPPIEG